MLKSPQATKKTPSIYAFVLQVIIFLSVIFKMVSHLICLSPGGSSAKWDKMTEPEAAVVLGRRLYTAQCELRMQRHIEHIVHTAHSAHSAYSAHAKTGQSGKLTNI